MRYRLIHARGTKSQAKFAAELGVSQTYLSELERGKRDPSIQVLRKLVRTLGIEVLEDFGISLPHQSPCDPSASGQAQAQRTKTPA